MSLTCTIQASSAWLCGAGRIDVQWLRRIFMQSRVWNGLGQVALGLVTIQHVGIVLHRGQTSAIKAI